jgi:hypothetical protein
MAKSAKKQLLQWLETLFGKEVLKIEYPSIGKKLVVKISEYSDEIRQEAMLHGFKQKFGDAKSGATAAEKYADVIAIHESLLAGEWERTATPQDRGPLICLAVWRLKVKEGKKITLEAVTSHANEVGEDEVKAWGAKKKVRAEIRRIEEERLLKQAEEEEEDLDDIEIEEEDSEVEDAAE